MKSFLFFFLLFSIGSCKSATNNGPDDSSDVEFANSLAILGQLVNGTANTLRDESRTDCSVVSYAACDSTQKRTKTFDSCTKTSTSGTITAFGQAILGYSPACATYPLPSNTIETRTYDDHYYTLATGKTVLLYTANESYIVGSRSFTFTDFDLQDYNQVVRSGGAVLTVGTPNTNRTLKINGIHRRTVSGGQLGLWHTLYTTSDINIAVISAQKSLTGSLILANNRGKYNVTYSFSNLTYNDGCNFPGGGSANVIVSDGTSTLSSYTLTFTGCGTATKSGTGETLTLDGGI